MKIYIGTDHTGFELKEKLKPFLVSLGHEVEDKGAFTFDPNDDYPDFIRLVAESVGQAHFGETLPYKVMLDTAGIILGGSGHGEAMVANRIPGARTAEFYGPRLPVEAVDVSGRKSEDPFEIVRLSRKHNNANILSIGFRFASEDDIKKAIEIWLSTPFEGGRHERRVQKIDL